MKPLVISRQFKGKLQVDGDDGCCFGEHIMLGERRNPNSRYYSSVVGRGTELIEWLDRIAKENEGKECVINIEVTIK